ncbi:MAG TPA: hypothetical protein DEQ80_00490 [Anaerolinea thermolimosa]|uniref:histidine kinase n=1 Tax=Anaerolinea thermolimosa TaxID=229919 RepID=A0A3D1JCJ7_9CHLR|nr:hypothetical protein [Anaerolinea thermolimosa]
MDRLRLLLVGFHRKDLPVVVEKIRQVHPEVEWFSAQLEDVISGKVQTGVFDGILWWDDPALVNRSVNLECLREKVLLSGSIVLGPTPDRAFLPTFLPGVKGVFTLQDPSFEEALTRMRASENRQRVLGVRDEQAIYLPAADLSDLHHRINQVSGTGNFLEAFFDIFALIVVVLDREGKILFFNRRAEMATGYSLAEVRGKLVKDVFLLPEEADGVMEVFNRLRRGDYPNQYQNSWLCRDGSTRKIEWSNTVLEDSQGEVRYIIGMGVDITEDYQKAQALRESEERFASVFRANPMGMAILSYPDGKIIDVNRALAGMLGRSPVDLIGKPCDALGLLTPDDFLIEKLTMGGPGNPVFTAERKVLSPEGTLRHVSINLDVFLYGSLPSYLLSVQDITERVRAEEHTRRFNEELEERVLERTAALEAVNRELQAEISFRKAIEATTRRLMQIIWETTDVVAIFDLEGRVLYLNKAGRRLFGINELDTVTHLCFLSVYSEETRQTRLEAVMRTLEQENIWHGEVELQLPDGRSVPVSQVVLAHRNLEGKIEFYSTIARDITEQRRVSEELRRAYQKELEVNRMRANFFSMTSHQFRTPLSTILSSVELLEHYGNRWPEEKRAAHLRKIRESTLELDQLLKDILEVSRIDGQFETLLVEAIDMPSLIERVVEKLQWVDGDAHPVRVDHPSDSRVLYSDRHALERILENLISNAMKYSPAGAPIEVVVRPLENGMEVTVSDRGIGIPEEDRPFIFQPFHRGRNVVDTPGSGIGLMIVEKSLSLIGGEIQLESRLGEGTVVHLFLPNLEPSSEADHRR